MQHYIKTMPGPSADLELEKDKPNGTYRLKTVLDQLEKDFYNKCYMCEDSPQSINIEHFIPHENDIDLKFSWANLCWSCAHCNNIKLAKYNDILDCINDTHVESKLEYICSPFPTEEIVINDRHNSVQSLKTRELLLGVFNGTTDMKKIESNGLRKKICQELLDLNSDILEFFDTKDPAMHTHLGFRITARLKPSARFSSFTRDYIRKHTTTLDRLRAQINNFPI